MKIYGFTLDPMTGIYKAYCSDGKRFSALVWSNGFSDYVKAGSAREGNRRTYYFTEAQSRAFTQFIVSGKYSCNYAEGRA